MDSWTRSSTKSSQSRCTSAYTVPASRHVSSKRQTGSAVSNDCDPSVMALAGLHITLRRATTDVWRTGSDHEKDASSVSGVSVGRVSAVSGSSVSRFKSGTNVYSRHRPLLATREKAVRGVAIGEGGGKTGSRHSKKNCDACSVQYMRHWFKARAEGRSESSLTQIGSDLQSERPQLYMVDQQSGLRPESTGAQGMSLPTVSVPASGLIKLTGLQHEMADPGYYEKRRQETGGSAVKRGSEDRVNAFFTHKSKYRSPQNPGKHEATTEPDVMHNAMCYIPHRSGTSETTTETVSESDTTLPADTREVTKSPSSSSSVKTAQPTDSAETSGVGVGPALLIPKETEASSGQRQHSPARVQPRRLRRKVCKRLSPARIFRSHSETDVLGMEKKQHWALSASHAEGLVTAAGMTRALSFVISESVTAEFDHAGSGTEITQYEECIPFDREVDLSMQGCFLTQQVESESASTAWNRCGHQTPVEVTYTTLPPSLYTYTDKELVLSVGVVDNQLNDDTVCWADSATALTKVKLHRRPRPCRIHHDVPTSKPNTLLEPIWRLSPSRFRDTVQTTVGEMHHTELRRDGKTCRSGDFVANRADRTGKHNSQRHSKRAPQYERASLSRFKNQSPHALYRGVETGSKAKQTKRADSSLHLVGTACQRQEKSAMYSADHMTERGRVHDRPAAKVSNSKSGQSCVSSGSRASRLVQRCARNRNVGCSNPEGAKLCAGLFPAPGSLKPPSWWTKHVTSSTSQPVCVDVIPQVDRHELLKVTALHCLSKNQARPRNGRQYDQFFAEVATTTFRSHVLCDHRAENVTNLTEDRGSFLQPAEISPAKGHIDGTDETHSLMSKESSLDEATVCPRLPWIRVETPQTAVWDVGRASKDVLQRPDVQTGDELVPVWKTTEEPSKESMPSELAMAYEAIEVPKAPVLTSEMGSSKLPGKAKRGLEMTGWEECQLTAARLQAQGWSEWEMSGRRDQVPCGTDQRRGEMRGMQLWGDAILETWTPPELRARRIPPLRTLTHMMPVEDTGCHPMRHCDSRLVLLQEQTPVSRHFLWQRITTRPANHRRSNMQHIEPRGDRLSPFPENQQENKRAKETQLRSPLKRLFGHIYRKPSSPPERELDKAVRLNGTNVRHLQEQSPNENRLPADPPSSRNPSSPRPPPAAPPYMSHLRSLAAASYPSPLRSLLPAALHVSYTSPPWSQSAEWSNTRKCPPSTEHHVSEYLSPTVQSESDSRGWKNKNAPSAYRHSQRGRMRVTLSAGRVRSFPHYRKPCQSMDSRFATECVIMRERRTQTSNNLSWQNNLSQKSRSFVGKPPLVCPNDQVLSSADNCSTRRAAEKETYERLHKEGFPSFQHRKSAVSVRQNSCKSVLRQRPEILEHVKAGERLLKYTENEMQRSQLEEQQDYEGLLQDILLYEIPGLSKPQN